MSKISEYTLIINDKDVIGVERDGDLVSVRTNNGGTVIPDWRTVARITNAMSD